MSKCGEFNQNYINDRSVQLEATEVLGDFDTLNFKGDVVVIEDPDGTACITVGETGQFKGKIIDFTFGTQGNTSNKWLNVASNGSVPSNEVPLIMPQDGDLVGITFANADDDVDQDIQVFVNGTLQFTWEIRNKRWAWKTNISMTSVSQGDRISVFMNRYDEGTGDPTSQNPIVEVFLVLTTDYSNEGGAQTGVT